MKEKLKSALKDKDFSELLRGSGISFILRFGGLAIGYLLTLVIAHLFGAEGLGEYVLAITILRMFTLFAKLGLDTTSIRFVAAFASQKKWTSISFFRKQVMLILSVTSVIFSLMMYLFASPIADLIQTNYRYIQLSAFFVLPMAFFMVNYESLRGLKRILEFSFFYRVSQGLFTIISIIILYYFFSKNADIPIYAYLTSVFIVSVLSFFSFRYCLNLKYKGEESAIKEIKSYSNLLKISIPLMFAQSVQFLMSFTDKLMLGNMATTEEVGVYHTAFKLSMFAAVALMSINSIASPKFAEMFADNNLIGLQKVVRQSTKMIFWTSIPLVIIFFLFPEFLLGLFGEEFKVGVTAFVFLSCGRLFSSFSGSVGNILQMTGNQDILAKILFIAAILNILLNLYLIPIYGIEGAAFASMLSLVFWNSAMIVAVKRKLGFYTFYIPFIKS